MKLIFNDQVHLEDKIGLGSDERYWLLSLDRGSLSNRVVVEERHLSLIL